MNTATRSPHWLEHLTDDGCSRAGWEAVNHFLNITPYREFQHLETLLAQRIREQEITYVPHAHREDDNNGPDLQLDPVPMVIGAREWQTLQRAVRQRAELVNRFLDDCYGPGRMFKDGIVPTGSVLGDARYLRPCRGWNPAGQRLITYAVDVIRNDQGAWQVVADHCQGLAGIGYALENRLVVARALPDLFSCSGVRRLSSFFDTLKATLEALSPQESPRVVLLADQQRRDGTFEQAYLARYLGYDVVDGRDLVVRGEQVFIKTLGGLLKVDVVLRRLLDASCDPLELAASGSGPAGLLRASAAHGLAMANPIGSAAAENPALARHWPQLCRHLLSEDLLLPSAQGTIAISNAPTWQKGHLSQRAVCVRLYAVLHRNEWQVMPGGLTRTLAGNDPHIINGAKDTWIVDPDSPEEHPPTVALRDPIALRRGGVDVPSLLLDDLYWLGRYVERAESIARITRSALNLHADRYGDDAEQARNACLTILGQLGAVEEAPPGEDGEVAPAPKIDTQAVILPLTDDAATDSLCNVLARIADLSTRVRSRLSRDAWRSLYDLATRMEEATIDSERRINSAIALCDGVIDRCAALAGALAENTVRGHAWTFLDMGRRLERACTTIHILQATCGNAVTRTHLEMVLDVADSLLTYRARYRGRLQPAPVVDLLLSDDSNPRSLLFQLQALQKRLQALPRDEQIVGPWPAEATIIGLSARIISADVVRLCRVDNSPAQAAQDPLPAPVSSPPTPQKAAAAPRATDDTHSGALGELLNSSLEQCWLCSQQIALTWFNHALSHSVHGAQGWTIHESEAP